MQRTEFASSILEAAVGAGAANTPADLIQALEEAFALVGFDYFRVVEAVSDGEARVLRYMIGKVNPAWETVYGEGRLAQHDPRLRRALTSSAPFFLTDVVAAAEVDDAERGMVEQAHQFGILESYILPHRDADNRQFAAVLSGPGRPITGLYRVAVHTISSAFLLAALRIQAQTIGGSGKLSRPALTIRQLQCLEWSRRGKSSVDIGKILQLSPRTVDEHFAVTCRVLQVRTRVQAVATALSIGLLPFRAADFSSSQRNP